MDRRELLLKVSAASVGLIGARSFAAASESVLGGPCEGCEWVFDGQPAKPGSVARIAPANERGRPMILEGVVTTLAGAASAGTIVYAYHTDDTGIYPRAGNRHGTLRGWARTDAQGRYRFESIRPRAYPSREIPEHVHMHVIEPGRGTYWIDDVHFTDDPLIGKLNGRAPERGGNGLATPSLRDSVWHVRRDIVLGRNIPAYR